jgi:threonine-phosphate decarboxylase
MNKILSPLNETADHGGNVFAIARALGVPLEELLDFSASINPLGPSPGVRDALHASYATVHHYPDRDAVALKEALARHHGLAPANIVAANGSTELIYLLPRLVDGCRALIIAPPFSEYARSMARAGCSCDYFTLDPADGFALSLPALAERLKEGYDLLFLANPGNPTGRLLPLTECQRLLELCRQNNTFLVLDEAFMDFCEEGSAKQLAVNREGMVILRSMTKFYAIPGLRLGFAIGAPPLTARLAGLQEPWSVNTAAQLAGIASLADNAYREQSLHYVASERARLFAGLAALPELKPYPSAANFLLVEITRPDLTAPQLYRQLLAQGIIIRTCGNFIGLDNRFFRIAVRQRQENEQLLAALAKLLDS